MPFVGYVPFSSTTPGEKNALIITKDSLNPLSFATRQQQAQILEEL